MQEPSRANKIMRYISKMSHASAGDLDLLFTYGSEVADALKTMGMLGVYFTQENDGMHKHYFCPATSR